MAVGADAVLELRLLKDHAVVADEGQVGLGFGSFQVILTVSRIDCLDVLDRVKVGLGRAGRRRVGTVLPGEDDVVGREVAAVRPLDAWL